MMLNTAYLGRGLTAVDHFIFLNRPTHSLLLPATEHTQPSSHCCLLHQQPLLQPTLLLSAQLLTNFPLCSAIPPQLAINQSPYTRRPLLPSSSNCHPLNFISSGHTLSMYSSRQLLPLPDQRPHSLHV
ncbi:hypothetical protein MRB53_032846 [Persea americana]|uniref:Uncharacterized protein n=1 Tax=Persea americana TaxID=3435 RepID=A0ACC2KT45_PERAE|nr:hypothetical protein MRB53_032846 [Persea americana]